MKATEHKNAEPHVNAALLRALADGEELEYQSLPDEQWWPLDKGACDSVFAKLIAGNSQQYTFRVKPKPRVFWVNIYDGFTSALFASREDAYKSYDKCHDIVKRLACLKFTEGQFDE